MLCPFLLAAGMAPIDILLLMAASEGDTPKVIELIAAGADLEIQVSFCFHKILEHCSEMPWHKSQHFHTVHRSYVLTACKACNQQGATACAGAHNVIACGQSAPAITCTYHAACLGMFAQGLFYCAVFVTVAYEVQGLDGKTALEIAKGPEVAEVLKKPEIATA